MTDFIVRPWRPEDKPQLTRLWETAFGDSPAYIRRFHDLFLTGERACIVAETGGVTASAMYLIPDVTLRLSRKDALTARYAYALATLPEYRGRGMGTAVYRAVCAAALETADAACVLPAEEALYPFYENASGAKPVSFVKQARFTPAELADVPAGKAARIPAQQYAWLRESLLAGMPHAALPDQVFELLEDGGADFFLLENGAALAETAAGVCHITELLAPGSDGIKAIAGIAAWCPAEEYIVRSPVFSDGPGEVRPLMLAALREPPSRPMPGGLWWGPGLE